MSIESDGLSRAPSKAKPGEVDWSGICDCTLCIGDEDVRQVIDELGVDPQAYGFSE